jgi:hypothetical protein
VLLTAYVLASQSSPDDEERAYPEAGGAEGAD